MKEASGPETQIDTPPLQIKRSHRYELELLEPGDKVSETLVCSFCFVYDGFL